METVLCELPRVVLVDRFLSDREIEQCIALGDGRWTTATVVHNDSGESVVDPYRTGEMVHITPEQASGQLITKIKDQTGAMLHVRAIQCEQPQLVKYGPGNQYKVHHDWFDPALSGPILQLKRGGQRAHSIIVCLKEAEEGGETEFPNLMIKVKLKPGQALMWGNYDHEGKPSTLADHAGLPVIKGEKIVMPIWVRERAADGSEEPEARSIAEIAAAKIAEAKAAAKVAMEAAEHAVEVEAESRVVACGSAIQKLLEQYGCKLWANPSVEVHPTNFTMRLAATVELNAIPRK